MSDERGSATQMRAQRYTMAAVYAGPVVAFDEQGKQLPLRCRDDDGHLPAFVLASDYDALAAENAALRSTIDDLTANEIHTCHDHCQRTACILRRENTALRSRLADIESQNRVMWDVANDREARLAEAESALRPLADIPLEDFGKERKPDYPLMGWNNHTIYVRDVLAARAFLAADSAPAVEQRLWLWRNGDHFLAFEHLYPCFTPGGDPMTLGEPVGYAIVKRSFDRAAGSASACAHSETISRYGIDQCRDCGKPSTNSLEVSSGLVVTPDQPTERVK